MEIFRAGINSLVDLNYFKVEYFEDGIEFYETGRDTVITEAGFA